MPQELQQQWDIIADAEVEEDEQAGLQVCARIVF